MDRWQMESIFGDVNKGKLTMAVDQDYRLRRQRLRRDAEKGSGPDGFFENLRSIARRLMLL